MACNSSPVPQLVHKFRRGSARSKILVLQGVQVKRNGRGHAFDHKLVECAHRPGNGLVARVPVPDELCQEGIVLRRHGVPRIDV